MANRSNLNKDGCEFGRLLSKDTKNLKKDLNILFKKFDEFTEKIDTKFEHIEETNRKMFNHLSKNVNPQTFKLILTLIGGISSIAGGIIGIIIGTII